MILGCQCLIKQIEMDAADRSKAEVNLVFPDSLDKPVERLDL
jgi:hypothetical protein